MDLPILLTFEIIILAGIIYYFSVQRKQLKDDEREWFERRKILDEEAQTQKESIDKVEEQSKSRSEFIVTESEGLANEIIEMLQLTLGETKSQANPIVLPDSTSYDLKFDEVKDQIKKLYLGRIDKLMKKLSAYEMEKAQKFVDVTDAQVERFAESFQNYRIEQHEKFDKQLKDYMQDEVSLFNQKVQKVIDQASLEVLGHQLTRSEHEELIEKALKKAREENGI